MTPQNSDEAFTISKGVVPPVDNGNEFNCAECNRSFNSNMALAMHNVRKHGYRRKRQPRPSEIGPFLCSACKKEYKSFAGRRYHEAKAHGIGDPDGWPMKAAKPGFWTKYNKPKRGRRAIRSQGGWVFGGGERKYVGIVGGKYECAYCPFTTNGKSGFTRHMRKQHPNATGLVELRRGEPSKLTFDCGYCDRVFKSERKLANHIRWNHPKETGEPQPATATVNAGMTERIMEMVAAKIATQMMEKFNN